MNKTMIITTLDPATRSEAQIISLVHEGMIVARIHLSHGDRASHQESISQVKNAKEKLDTTGQISFGSLATL